MALAPNFRDVSNKFTNAVPFPIFLECLTTIAPNDSAIAAVLSLDPSSQTTTASTNLLALRTTPAIAFSSLKAGMQATIIRSKPETDNDRNSVGGASNNVGLVEGSKFLRVHGQLYQLMITFMSRKTCLLCNSERSLVKHK